MTKYLNVAMNSENIHLLRLALFSAQNSFHATKLTPRIKRDLEWLLAHIIMQDGQ